MDGGLVTTFEELKIKDQPGFPDPLRYIQICIVQYQRVIL